MEPDASDLPEQVPDEPPEQQETDGPEQKESFLRRRWALLLVLLLGGLLVGGLYWKKVAATWCGMVASLTPVEHRDVVAWNAGALGHLGPDSVSWLAALVSRGELVRAWAGGAGLYIMYREDAARRGEVEALLDSGNERVRAAVAMILVSGPWHRRAGLETVVGGLDSEDPDIRFFSAYYLSFYPPDRFLAEVKDPAGVYRRMVENATKALTDKRTYYSFSGISGTGLVGTGASVEGKARYLVRRLLPDLVERLEKKAHSSDDTSEGGEVPFREPLKRLLEEQSAESLFERARKTEARGTFFHPETKEPDDDDSE